MFGQKIKIGDKAVVFFMLKNIIIMISQTKVVVLDTKFYLFSLFKFTFTQT